MTDTLHRTARLNLGSSAPLAVGAATAAPEVREAQEACKANTVVTVVAWVGLVPASVDLVVPAAATARSTCPTFVPWQQISVPYGACKKLTCCFPQLPYTAGWQDLKDLFRQAGAYSADVSPTTYNDC